MANQFALNAVFRARDKSFRALPKYQAAINAAREMNPMWRISMALRARQERFITAALEASPVLRFSRIAAAEQERRESFNKACTAMAKQAKEKTLEECAPYRAANQNKGSL